jgi:hypothetical protein
MGRQEINYVEKNSALPKTLELAQRCKVAIFETRNPKFDTISNGQKSQTTGLQ